MRTTIVLLGVLVAAFSIPPSASAGYTENPCDETIETECSTECDESGECPPPNCGIWIDGLCTMRIPLLGCDTCDGGRDPLLVAPTKLGAGGAKALALLA